MWLARTLLSWWTRHWKIGRSQFLLRVSPTTPLVIVCKNHDNSFIYIRMWHNQIGTFQSILILFFIIFITCLTVFKYLYSCISTNCSGTLVEGYQANQQTKIGLYLGSSCNACYMENLSKYNKFKEYCSCAEVLISILIKPTSYESKSLFEKKMNPIFILLGLKWPSQTGYSQHWMGSVRRQWCHRLCQDWLRLNDRQGVYATWLSHVSLIYDQFSWHWSAHDSNCFSFLFFAWMIIYKQALCCSFEKYMSSETIGDTLRHILIAMAKTGSFFGGHPTMKLEQPGSLSYKQIALVEE